MKRLLLLTMISLLAASTGCQSTGGGGGLFSRCRLFNSGSRGDACGACAVATPSACPCPCPCQSSGPVYSQSIPVYSGFSGGGGCDSGCCGSGFGGYNGGMVYGDTGGFGGCASGNCGGGCASGNCSGGMPGMQYQPGTVIPGQGMVIDGSGIGSQQIPYLPAPQQQAPQTAPAPQTPGPAPGT